MDEKKLSTIEEAEQTINQILTRRAQEIDSTSAKIEEVDQTITAALEKLEKATFEGNEALYKQAQAELDRAQGVKEYHKKRLDTIRTKSLINETEYNRFINGIYSDFETLDAQTREKLATLCDEITQIADEYTAKTAHINNILHRLQCDVYKMADCRKDRNGQHYLDPNTEKKVKFTATLKWAQCAIKNTQYREYRGLPSKSVSF